MLRFCLLGPVGVSRDGAALALGGPKQRAVLAVLLLNANRVVPIHRIVDDIWGDRTPDRSVNTVQVYVSSLRRVLEPEPPADPAARLLTTHGAAYRLRADERSLDLLEFLALAAEGRRRLDAGRPSEAADHLRRASALFRGAPLADLVEEPFAHAELAAIEESRIAALEAAIEADLACGRATDVVGELRALVAEHPLRERFHGLLAEALYRAGRQGEALAVFRNVRQVLAEQLGVDPGTELRALERSIRTHAQLDQTVRRGQPFLLLPDGDGRQQVRPLDAASSPVTVGRSSANDVCVSWDAEVSREHAILEYRGDGWDLVDEGRSRNGTFVDGERVSGRYTLQDAQVIRVGNTVLLYRSTGAATRLPARGSVVTAAARVRSAAEVGPDERALLTALNRGEVGESAELAALRRRFDVQSLPPGERDVVLLQRARALRLLPDT